MGEPRYNLKFNERQQQALEEMAEDMHTTKADVVRKALSLLEVVLREKKNGNQLTVSKGDKIVKEIVGID